MLLTQILFVLVSKLPPIRCRPPPVSIEARALIIWLGQRAHIRWSLIKVWQSELSPHSGPLFRAPHILIIPSWEGHLLYSSYRHSSPTHPLYLWPTISCESSCYKEVIKNWSSSILLAKLAGMECDGLRRFSVKLSWHSRHVLCPVYIIHRQGHWLTLIALVSGMRHLATIQSLNGRKHYRRSTRSLQGLVHMTDMMSVF